MSGIGEAASVIAVIGLSAKVASLCFQYSREVAGAKKEITSLRAELSSLQSVLEKLNYFLEQPGSVKLSALPETKHALDDTTDQLNELDKRLDFRKDRNPMKRFGLRALKWPLENKEVEKMIDCLGRYKSTINLALQARQTSLLETIDRKLDLDKLPQAKGAAFDSYADENEPRCHPDTRRDLLREIDDWVDDPDGKCIFWLYGMAGTGKSTISRTVAKSLSARGVLLASFFFKRGVGDRGNASRLFTTIARQLANKLPELVPHIANALENDPDVIEKAVETQCEELVLKPLSAIWQRSSTECKVAAIVIDALDECEEEPQRIQKIIYLLFKLRDAKGIDLRVFVTSRPEPPVRLVFDGIGSDAYKNVALHEIPEHIIDHDLRVFLASELEQIRKKRSIQPPWPTQDDLDALVQITRPLFIHAATLCRFVSDRFLGDPRELLQNVLQSGGNSSTSDLSATYHPVLHQLVAKRQKSSRNTVLHRFELIIGATITLFTPLPKAALVALLNMSTSHVDSILDCLHSVLRVPNDSTLPIQLFHLSFHDFLVDQEQCEADFWIEEEAAHRRTATRCIEIMQKGLRENICGLEYPGKPRCEIGSEIIHASLPAELRYACRYWVYHLQGSGRSIHDNDDVHTFLRTHLLHLLEALGLMGRISESISIIATLKTLLSTDHSSKSLTLLKDAKRFVLANRAVIDLAPLQVYCSALVFAPENSIIRRMFSGCIPYKIKSIPNLQSDWSSQIQTLEGHNHFINAVTFSPDNKQLATGSHDKTIRIWDVATGELRQTLVGHSAWVKAIAFTPDGKQLASGSYDMTVRLWDVATGELRQTFEGHLGQVLAVAFSSPDGKQLVSGSNDNTIRLWDVTTGEQRQTFDLYGKLGRAMAFSLDGKRLVSGSNDNTIRLWDVTTGEQRQTFDLYGKRVRAMAFSLDGKRLASGSDEKIVRVWDVTTGELQKAFEGHNGAIRTVAFSPDGKQLASGSEDTSIRLWDLETGKVRQVFIGHSSAVWSIAFSPNGKQLASGSTDKTVRHWAVEVSELRCTVSRHNRQVWTVAFSPDGEQLVSGSSDSTVQVWDVATGEVRQTLEGHRSAVRAFIGTISTTTGSEATIHESHVSVTASAYPGCTNAAQLTSRIESVTLCNSSYR